MSEPAAEVRNSVQPFSQALRDLMEKRRISYRMLATRTKLSAGYLNHLACGSRAVPSDHVIKILAKALRAKPEYFFEYRQRGLHRELYRAPDVADRLYDFLVADKPLAKDLRAALESLKKK